MAEIVPGRALRTAGLVRRLAAAVLVGGVLGLGACQMTSDLVRGRDIRPGRDTTPKAPDCSQGGPGCHPTDRRQYYDDRTARYYYFDPATGRYYWENGDPRF
jgi:hypothetical protein